MRRLLFLLALAACTPAHAPQTAHTPNAALVESETVALVAPGPEGIQPYCSGVWVAQDAILTANHCIEDLDPGERVLYAVRGDVLARRSDEVEAVRFGEVVATDPEHDLALVMARLPPEHGTARTSHASVGEYVQTEGHPLGLWWSYSSGTVAALRVDDGLWYVQSTAPISPGNSGGGLFDVDGNLLGVCRAYVRGGENLNLYVDSRHVEAFLSAQGL